MLDGHLAVTVLTGVPLSLRSPRLPSGWHHDDALRSQTHAGQGADTTVPVPVPVPDLPVPGDGDGTSVPDLPGPGAGTLPRPSPP